MTASGTPETTPAQPASDPERLQQALYRIADASSAASDMTAFYRAIHESVGELMDARNFYVALYDVDRGAINFPYYVDTVDEDIPGPAAWEPFGPGGMGALRDRQRGRSDRQRPAHQRAPPEIEQRDRRSDAPGRTVPDA